MMVKNNRDIVYLYDGMNCNFNGDPDMENKPRMDMDTKTLLVSDVSVKREVRDFYAAKGYEIFVNMMNEKKVTPEKRFESIIKAAKMDKASPEEKINLILENMADIRMFGSAFAIGKINKAITGPIQLTWGYSLHPVDLVKSSSIVTIMNDDNSTFGKMYKAAYALVAHSASVNKYAAVKTGLTEEDVILFEKALIQAKMNHLTHSKQGQQPLLLLEVVYADDFDGYLGDLRRYLQVNLKKSYAIRSLEDVEVDFGKLSAIIEDYKAKGYIKAVHIWTSPLADFINMPQADELDLLDTL